MRFLIIVLWSLVMMFFLEPTVLAQNSSQQEVASINSSITGVIRKVCIKPEKGDDRPLTAFAIQNELNNQLTMILLPANSGSQDDQIREVLEVCAIQEVTVTISGNWITHANKFGSSDYLVIYELRIRTVTQVLIMQWPKD